MNSLIWTGVLAHIVLYAIATEDEMVNERYVATLAKNGRLPKFGFAPKKREQLSEASVYSKFVVPVFYMDPEIDSDQYLRKRNVAALARLGRLNTIRYGRFQPHYVIGKRVNEDIIVKGKDGLCLAYGEAVMNTNEKQKKRYVAALARSGRLPTWIHFQRGGKRDDLHTISGIPFSERCPQIIEYKRQKRNAEGINVDENQDINNPDQSEQYGNDKKEIDLLLNDETLNVKDYVSDRNYDESSGQYEVGKKNVASLARNGKLKFAGNNDGKRRAENEIFTGEEKKRNIASLSRNGKLLVSKDSEGKLNAASRNSNFPSVEKILSFSDDEEKRSLAHQHLHLAPLFSYRNGIQTLARNGKLPIMVDENIAVMEPSFHQDKRNNELPKFQYVASSDRNVPSKNVKRNLASLARNGKLPYFDLKRNVAALARNRKLRLLDTREGKRNVAALSRNNKLEAFKNEGYKRSIAYLARFGKIYSEEKRNIAALARNGKLPSFNSGEEKRNIAALARNGKLPSFNSGDEKRNIAALARNGKLPSFNSGEGKRNMAALARNGKLISFNSGAEKRNIAALARNGKLPSFNSVEEKRNIAALNGRLPSFDYVIGKEFVFGEDERNRQMKVPMISFKEGVF